MLGFGIVSGLQNFWSECVFQAAIFRAAKAENKDHFSWKGTVLTIRLCEHLADRSFNFRNPRKTVIVRLRFFMQIYIFQNIFENVEPW